MVTSFWCSFHTSEAKCNHCCKGLFLLLLPGTTGSQFHTWATVDPLTFCIHISHLTLKPTSSLYFLQKICTQCSKLHVTSLIPSCVHWWGSDMGCIISSLTICFQIPAVVNSPAMFAKEYCIGLELCIVVWVPNSLPLPFNTTDNHSKMLPVKNHPWPLWT